MYSNSTAKIKLLNKLSNKIDVLCGTEQGHPMSPELFKCYINDLSEKLNTTEGINVPVLDEVKISHLLWADDLVLIALDTVSLQNMLDVLKEYCLTWGLSVNITKTAEMVFSKSGRLLKDSLGFVYGEDILPSVREYCYLGLVFSLNGSLTIAQNKLRQKGIRSYFALKKMIDFNCLKKQLLLNSSTLLLCQLSPMVVKFGLQKHGSHVI